MVEIYVSEGGRLCRTEEYVNGAWIYAVSPTEKEIGEISKISGISEGDILTSLDEEESGRIERLDDGVTLIVTDTPIARKDENNVVNYSVSPVGIYFTENYIVTVCTKDTTVLKDFTKGFLKNLDPSRKTEFYLKLMLYASGRYMHYLRQIDKMTDYIEKRLHKATKNAELLQMLDLKKSLVYLKTALKNIDATLYKVERGKYIKLYEEDADLLDDVIIEYRQAREMADTFESVLTGTIETISSVISNNLNETMRRLTSITVLIAIPTMIAGFYGMNIGMSGIPGPGGIGGFLLVTGLSLLISGIVGFILYKKKML